MNDGECGDQPKGTSCHPKRTAQVKVVGGIHEVVSLNSLKPYTHTMKPMLFGPDLSYYYYYHHYYLGFSIEEPLARMSMDHSYCNATNPSPPVCPLYTKKCLNVGAGHGTIGSFPPQTTPTQVKFITMKNKAVLSMIVTCVSQ